jgi:RNA polymerase sigma-70 factor (ECF subfamily)
VKDSRNVVNRRTDSDTASSISSSLLLRLKARHPEAWDRLANLYGPLVHHWCLRTGLQEADAEDVVQEVFRTVAARIATFRRQRKGDTFRGWLFTITRNKIGDFVRRRRGRANASGGTDALVQLSEVAADEDLASATESTEVGGLYQRVLGLVRFQFEERTWQAFWRVVVAGQSPADVAADLDVTVNTVYIAKSRILRRLREELGDPVD